MISLARTVALLRPLHWVKNLVVVAPLLFAGLALDANSVEQTGLVLLAFCLAASGVYVLNDLHDRSLDALHPAKRSRPLVTGDVPIPFAAVLALVFVLLGVAAAGLAQDRAPPLDETGLGTLGPRDWTLAYLALNAAYTLFLKRVPFVDLITLAVGFTLRAFAGAAALQLLPSAWLVSVCFCLALFLATGKRRLERARLGEAIDRTRPMASPYRLALLDKLLGFTAVLTLVAYIVYTVAPDTVAKIGSRQLALTIPLVAAGLFRYLRLARGDNDGDPVELLASDVPFLACGVGWCGLVGWVLYWPLR